MSKYVITRADFGGNTRYIKGFNMVYDINDADKFDTVEDAKSALRHHILTRVDFNLSVGTLNKIMSHYNIEEVNNMNRDITEATKLALQNKLQENKSDFPTTLEDIFRLLGATGDIFDDNGDFTSEGEKYENILHKLLLGLDYVNIIDFNEDKYDEEIDYIINYD